MKANELIKDDEKNYGRNILMNMGNFEQENVLLNSYSNKIYPLNLFMG